MILKNKMENKIKTIKISLILVLISKKILKIWVVYKQQILIIKWILMKHKIKNKITITKIPLILVMI